MLHLGPRPSLVGKADQQVVESHKNQRKNVAGGQVAQSVEHPAIIV